MDGLTGPIQSKQFEQVLPLNGTAQRKSCHSNESPEKAKHRTVRFPDPCTVSASGSWNLTNHHTAQCSPTRFIMIHDTRPHLTG